MYGSSGIYISQHTCRDHEVSLGSCFLPSMLFWVSLSYFSVAMLCIPEELVRKFPGNSPISTFFVTIQGLGLQTYTTGSCFYRFHGSNGRPQWALFPTKPSPLPIKCIFTMCFCIFFLFSFFKQSHNWGFPWTPNPFSTSPVLEL